MIGGEDYVEWVEGGESIHYAAAYSNGKSSSDLFVHLPSIDMHVGLPAFRETVHQDQRAYLDAMGLWSMGLMYTMKVLVQDAKVLYLEGFGQVNPGNKYIFNKAIVKGVTVIRPRQQALPPPSSTHLSQAS